MVWEVDLPAVKLTRLHDAAVRVLRRMMELSDLLAKAGGLSEAQQRKVAAILGSLVADAAGMCTHYIADRLSNNNGSF